MIALLWSSNQWCECTQHPRTLNMVHVLLCHRKVPDIYRIEVPKGRQRQNSGHWEGKSQASSISSRLHFITVEVVCMYVKLRSWDWGFGSAGRECLPTVHGTMGSVPSTTDGHCGSAHPQSQHSGGRSTGSRPCLWKYRKHVLKILLMHTCLLYLVLEWSCADDHWLTVHAARI